MGTPMRPWTTASSPQQVVGEAAVEGDAEQAVHDAEQREGGGDEDDEAVGEDFCQHDFAGGDGHHQQVFDGAVFAFADDRRADEQQ